MTTIKTGKSQRRVPDAACDMADSLADLHLDADRGGLVIIGPTDGALAGMETLLEASNVAPVKALGSRMASWKTASAEATEVGRAVSHAIRSGRTAVVYLDSHVGGGEPIPVNLREFVCLRLSQLMVGVADVPAFVALHGERMAWSLIIDSLGEEHPSELGSITSGCPLWQLTSDTMFPGVVVSMCPGDRDANAVVAMLDWLGSRRS